jgi:hypothetical protein
MLSGLLSSCRDNNALLFQHFRQRSILMHRHENIATTNELLIDVKLRYGWPLGVLFDTYESIVSIACPMQRLDTTYGCMLCAVSCNKPKSTTTYLIGDPDPPTR